VRLAEIAAHAWGNLRVEARTTGEDDRFVYAEALAWDMQTNVAIRFTTRRRITNRSGQKFNDDMIAVTGNAATSIALRNAVFKVIPMAFVNPLWAAAVKVAVGDIKTLATRRAGMLQWYANLGIVQDRILAFLEKPGVQDIDLHDLKTLKGLATAIDTGEIEPDNAIPEIKTEMLGTDGKKISFGKNAEKGAPETKPDPAPAAEPEKKPEPAPDPTPAAEPAPEAEKPADPPVAAPAPETAPEKPQEPAAPAETPDEKPPAPPSGDAGLPGMP